MYPYFLSIIFLMLFFHIDAICIRNVAFFCPMLLCNKVIVKYKMLDLSSLSSLQFTTSNNCHIGCNIAKMIFNK